MKLRVFVSFRKGILDPEAEAIKKIIVDMGHKNIIKISKGSFFDIEVNKSEKDSKKIVKKISQEVLSNPIIENFTIDVVD
ncbi:MAG: phosphoribosylformylglycinamidine synthase, purS protein [Rickettsiales bacterium]|jgi:phosphoribosylformylglycinamidine synthase|nr:phosphoribosylformylglycinamidine synthase, purS protein [Rickettsiales bacterium]OUW71335.1 MAG: phosphoribosylformylglycinamidine synthase, purS protein [Rickettsiales bacterium TMED211]|tara:strand:- start:187 stop:426 length:240 start_codon:yes stop_codon:yes gene_type:complete